MCVYTPLPLPVLAVLHILSLKILTYLYSQWTQTHDTVSIPNILAPPFQKLRLILLKHTATAFLSGTLYIESAVKAGIFPLYDDCTALDTVSSGLRTLPRCVVSRTLVTTRTSFQVLAKEVITGSQVRPVFATSQKWGPVSVQRLLSRKREADRGHSRWREWK